MDGFMGAGYFFADQEFNLRFLAIGVESMPKSEGRKHDAVRMAADIRTMLARFDGQIKMGGLKLPPIDQLVFYATSDEAKAMLKTNRILLGIVKK